MGGGGDGPPQDCYTRMVHATTGGAISGLVGGAIVSNWGDVPLVLRSKNWPALKRTGGMMRQYGLAIGFVGLAYSASECFSESLRGKKDMWNSVIGSAGAGGVLGVVLGRMPLAAGAAALMAVTSVAVDLSGGSLIGHGMIDDGATPPRNIYPYPQQPQQ
mmetsp:Transcript_8119/g.24139  ORF Transcript_8119/g.24139 Transcript_8119/m.24139 type:complete len:160 (+) Transcript_8119:241-720(+)